MATPTIDLSNTPSWATPRTGEIREEIRWWEAQKYSVANCARIASQKQQCKSRTVCNCECCD